MSVAQRLQVVRDRIADAALRSQRSLADVSVVGCKPGSVQDVIEASAAGLIEIGENRVQEASAKAAALGDRPSALVHWHMIGHLQSNKVKAALGLFETIHSIDSERLAMAVSQASTQPIPVYLEVQFGRAPERFGFAPDTVDSAFDTIASLPRLDVRGLMTIAPLGLDAAGIRGVFRRLREIRDQIQETHAAHPPLGLSMGMTEDYEIAIEEGATIVRIGRAIFAA